MFSDAIKLVKQEMAKVLEGKNHLIASPYNPVQTSSNVDRKDLDHATI